MPTTENRRKLLLDTHVWIWLMEGNPKLSPAVRKQIQKAVPDNSIRVSAISVWEVAILESKGRIVFNEDCRLWVNKASSAPGISLIHINPDILIESTRLPGTFHGDPADRMIAATARTNNCTLITADSSILSYATTGFLKVISAT